MNVRGKRFDIAPDTGPNRDLPASSWWVVDMTTFTGDPTAYPNVGIKAGPFYHAGEAFDYAAWANGSLWSRLRRGPAVWGPWNLKMRIRAASKSFRRLEHWWTTQ